MTMIRMPEVTGTETSFTARLIRCSRGSRLPGPASASCATTFSTTTTAASTNMPMAIASPPRLMRFADRPNPRMRMKVASAASGRISATVSAARRFPSMSTRITSTSTTASASAFDTVRTARPTKSPRS